MNNKYKILPGTFINELVTIGVPYKNELGLTVVKTICNCGEESIFEVLDLINGDIIDCGCSKFNRVKVKLSPNERCIYAIYNVYRRGAKIRNLKFCLTKQEFGSFLFKPCYYCNSAPLGTYIGKKTKIKNKEIVKYNGIDRVNNKLGYNMHNCVTCCKICNKIKSKFGAEDYKIWLQNIAANYLLNSKKIQGLYVNPNAQITHFNTDDVIPYHA